MFFLKLNKNEQFSPGSGSETLQERECFYLFSVLRVNSFSFYIVVSCSVFLKVIYHPLNSMNNFVTNESKLPQDGAQVFPYMGWLAIMWPFKRVLW